jgi:hypothetical protein
MPGKVNPTQAEAMLMVAIQVIASDAAVTMGGAEGNFELNAFRPVLISNYLHSALIMADMCDHFRKFMVEGTKLNQAKLKQDIDRSVMMVTALSPIIGYDKAAAISYYAIDHDLALKPAALANGVSEELFDKVVDPLALTRPGSADVPSGPGKPDMKPPMETRAGRGPEPVGRAALIASVGGQRGWADWANPEHRLRRLLAEFIGMAGLTFVLSGGRGHPGPVRRPPAATLADGPGAFPRLGVVAGGGGVLPRRHLGPFQPGHHAGVRAAPRHELGDGRRLLDRPVRRRRRRIAARPRLLRPAREPGRHHAQARPVLAGGLLRGHPHPRPGTHGPQPANGPKLNGPFVPLAVGAYILAWGTMGGPYDGASMNPARSFGPDLAIGNLSTWWVYLIGPVAGAIIAVGIAHVLRGPAKAQEAGAAEGTPLDRST